MGDLAERAAQLLTFWRKAGQEAWFRKDATFDAEFHARFHELHYQAARRELDGWASHPEGSLALLLLLDQFPRNCFRSTAHMYATDPLARFFARQACAASFQDAVEPELRTFFLLPFMHSESLADQHLSVEHALPLGGETLKHANGHRDIIQRFGRFPHRNPMLGRETTPAEQAFLDAGGFAG